MDRIRKSLSFTDKYPIILLLILIMPFLFSSCGLMEGIFQAGVGLGILVAVIVIAIVIFIVSRFRKR